MSNLRHIIGLLFFCSTATWAAVVKESAREIPVAHEADVLVVGGSFAAVEAAVEAAQNGAKVFLVAPRPYLGEDLAGTLRLWLEPGESPSSPLAQEIFLAATNDFRASANRLALTYETDVASGGAHPDTKPPSVLTDGAWGSASGESVQYLGDVNIIADLKSPQELASVRLMSYQRPAGKFGVQRVTVFVSDDKQSWREIARMNAPVSTTAGKRTTQDECQTWSAPFNVTARYVKFAVKQSLNATRMLLGEIEVLRVDKNPPLNTIPPPRPLQVKKTLDDALIKAGVPFLYSCQPTHVLRDDTGNPCGIVMANRAGRQAVIAKVIIDATERATVARLAGADFRPYPAGQHTFKRVVIGGEVREGDNLTARVIAPPYTERAPDYAGKTNVNYQIIEYTLKLPMAGDTPAAWAEADQMARTFTYHPAQQFSSDMLFEVPPDAIYGRTTATNLWLGSRGLPMGAFQPRNVDRLFVLGGCADVPRGQAEKLMRPWAREFSAGIGESAAVMAKALRAPKNPHVVGGKAGGEVVAGEVRELLTGVRPTQKSPTIPQEAGFAPVWGDYDVVVIGGGTAGAPAGIAAARQGAKTLVVEALSGLGGVGTLGTIAGYCSGNRVGFTASIKTDPQPWKNGGHVWGIEQKANWWRSERRKAGADVWFGATGCGALVEDHRITGAVLATPQGRGVVRAKVVIDATGNSDIAAAAGAACIYTDGSDFGMQGTGLSPRLLGVNLINTDYTLTDETDLLDVWHLYVFAKQKFPTAFDLSQLIDTRERRRIVGDHVLTVRDQFASRTYPDTVVQAHGGGYDTHGYVVDRFLHIWPTPFPAGKLQFQNIPYRSLLPKGWDGILVVALGISAHRDAVPLIRMQPDIQNGGYAAGVAAAMAVKSGKTARTVDVRAVQQHLVSIGGLTTNVLTDMDSFPLSDAQLATAVAQARTNMFAGAALFVNPEPALPLLRQAHASAEGADRVQYAAMLGMLGDPSGAATLTTYVQQTPWDTGWTHRGAGNVSVLDGRLIALGCTGDRNAVPAIVAKLQQLKPDSEFSHFRAAALALEAIGDRAAAKPLADALALPGLTGYAHTTLAQAIQREVEEKHNTIQTRHDSLRELMLARALYRCGDQDGVGEKILRAYAADLRGHLARHAQAVLDAGKQH
ncbi:MAG: FAD-dependent oxidoreductase [Kiritimatiellaeota bacterium]|nr:FAD-dependent oxidoreductase [Kiritimatiellota bacterium]